MQVCQRCGDENSDRARFCQTCGEPLAEPVTRREIRKVVTVLFLDVVGSTELGERLDPESTRRVMGRLFDVVRPVLEHHGGTVEKFIGDAVMAVFGIPALHEDDALRACRAALEIRNEIGRLNKELERDWGLSISTRTGINTGEVIAGDPSSGQTLVTGDPVNTAARLEQSAPPGMVLIGESTYRLTADAVDVEPTEPVAAKGKGEAVTAYRLLSVLPEVPGRAGRLDSPMVGRLRELGLLKMALDRTVAEHRCVLATVVGMAGVGKSRLVHEFVASEADRVKVLRGRCLPYGEGITFWPVANVVHQAAGISESDTPDVARSRIEALLPEGGDRPIIRDRVASSVGLGEATWSIQETFWAIRKLLESIASDRPLIVVFDDIQWSEPAFLDLIEYLEGWGRATPILLLCIARPELLETRAGWASAATKPTTVALEPLSGEESDRLIKNLLGPSAITDRFRGRIAEAADGNPLFVEEMLGMLIDEARLRREEGRWVATGDDFVPTPPSIQSLLAARIEQLPEAERELLQRASVIGRVFWWGAVVDLSPGDRTRIGSQLQNLVRKGMIRPDQTAFAGQDAFRFRHLLIRDAAYDSVPRAVRADLHERLATWIEAMFGERVEEYEEIVGYHLEQACHQRLSNTLGESAARAGSYLASAGRRAFERGDVSAAINLLGRAWTLNPGDEPETIEARLVYAEALRLGNNFQQADDVLRDLERRAGASEDRRVEWRARIQRLRLRFSTTRVTFDEVKSDIDRAVEVLGELGDDLGLAQAWGLVGWIHFNSGRSSEALQADAKAAHHARSAGDTSREMWAITSELGAAAYGATPVDEALMLCDEVLELVKGRPANEAAVHQHRGVLEAMRGNLEEARTALSHARSVWTELGVSHALASMTDKAGDVELFAGDLEAAERQWRTGYEAFKQSGADSYRATWAAWLARVIILQERDDREALALTRESEMLAAEDDITAQGPWREARAIVLARRGEFDQAERLVREAIAIAEGTDWLNLQGDAYLELANVLRMAGRPEEAANVARAAVERYERKGNVVAAGWAHALLADLAPSAT